MPSDPRDEAARDSARIPVRVREIGSETPGDEVLEDLSPRERLELLHELSARMWELTGRPVPDYARSDIPVRIVRRA